MKEFDAGSKCTGTRFIGSSESRCTETSYRVTLSESKARLASRAAGCISRRSARLQCLAVIYGVASAIDVGAAWTGASDMSSLAVAVDRRACEITAVCWPRQLLAAPSPLPLRPRAGRNALSSICSGDLSFCNI